MTHFFKLRAIGVPCVPFMKNCGTQGTGKIGCVPHACHAKSMIFIIGFNIMTLMAHKSINIETVLD